MDRENTLHALQPRPRDLCRWPIMAVHDVRPALEPLLRQGLGLRSLNKEEISCIAEQRGFGVATLATQDRVLCYAGKESYCSLRIDYLLR